MDNCKDLIMNPFFEILQDTMKEYPLGQFCWHKASADKGIINAYRIDGDMTIGIEVDFGDSCQNFQQHSLTTEEPKEGIPT